MPIVRKLEFADIINELPDIILFNPQELSGNKFDAFFCALGFEDRCLTIPEQLIKVNKFECTHSIYFKYSTNIKDNKEKEPKLKKCLQEFSKRHTSLPCDNENFRKKLREFLVELTSDVQTPKVIFDISSCSSMLLLTTLKTFLEFNLNLSIVYSEAAIYHPTPEEFKENPNEWSKEEGFGLTKGVSKVISVSEFPGARRELPDFIIAFLHFKPERIKRIITHIDETIFTAQAREKRIVFIIGDPHMDNSLREQRKKIMLEINKEVIEQVNKSTLKAEIKTVSTLYYKQTLHMLEQIYKKYNLKYHINIAALGSKMQNIGVAFFSLVCPDVSVWNAVPRVYNAKHYSEGCKNIWQLELGKTQKLLEILNKVDKLKIEE